MYYKLSNTAERSRIERRLGLSFKHPNLYKPEVVINGLIETNVSIVTAEQPELISLGIWGILPEEYTDEWTAFQNVTNTLHFDYAGITSDLWYSRPFKHRRCLFIVTGFFTCYLRDGKVYPYHIGLKSGAPFYLAGVYNVLEDGFITCSLLVKKADDFIKKFQNVGDKMPIVIKESLADIYLDDSLRPKEIKEFLGQDHDNKLHATPIEKEFFNQNISYDSMLGPYDYGNLPTDE
ncbi:SOS response-associated peptidase [Aggregatimonas sangjinii]|uniref:Abasic site processing protein n=1 Tax=Aggregatimonas sangjinii TaxID=2583587 RepID=A0A5B7ST58_9FLAO|nr:SOS response-associated peptidase family protein [Aggregatimonas sangjinii]QCX01965.1 SOS response-associated peptidase [Aggregatimonas sangjinii]